MSRRDFKPGDMIWLQGNSDRFVVHVWSDLRFDMNTYVWSVKLKKAIMVIGVDTTGNWLCILGDGFVGWFPRHCSTLKEFS